MIIYRCDLWKELDRLKGGKILTVSPYKSDSDKLTDISYIVDKYIRDSDFSSSSALEDIITILNNGGR